MIIRGRHLLLVSLLAVTLSLDAVSRADEAKPAKAEQAPAAGGPVDTTPAGDSVQQPAAPAKDGMISKSGVRQRKGKSWFALTLAGGGARGAAHIGVLKVLEAEGIKPDLISGSSSGALIGALFCAGVPAAEIERLWLSGKVRKAFFPRPLQIQALTYFPRYMLARVLRLKPIFGLYSGRSVAKFVNKNLPSGVGRMEDMKIPFAAIATNILDTRPVWISKGDVGEAVRASCTIPYFYRPARINGRLLIDGGIRSNLPTDVAQEAGAPVVVAVKLHSSLRSEPEAQLKGVLDYSGRIASILMAEIEAKNVADADVLIEPDMDSVRMDSFKRESLEQAIAAGEAATLKMLPAIREQLHVKHSTAMKNGKRMPR